MIGLASLIPSIIGIGAKVATAIPGMKKPKRQNTAKEVAKTAGAQFGQAVGAAQVGHGASRGLALREGLRAGTQAVGAQSQAIAGAALGDAAAYEQAKAARAKNIAAFGTDLAKGLGDAAAGMVGPKKADGAGKAEPVAETPTDANAAGEVLPGQGVREAPLPEDTSMGLGDLEQGQEDQAAVEQQQLIDSAQEGLGKLQEARGATAGPKAAFQVEPATALIEARPPRVQPQIEQQLASRLHMKELMLAEAERLGIGVETMLARVNRRLQLRPGQSVSNPFAVDMSGGTDGENV
jgi:hypothetical protein